MPAIPNPKRIKSEVKDWWETLLPIAVTIIIIVIVWKLYKAAKAAGNAAGQELGINATAIKTGISPDRISYIANLGRQLWDEEVSGATWFSNRNYNEEAFIAALNQMQSLAELQLLDQYYRQAAGESLRHAVTKSFSAADKAAVKPKTLTALLQMV